MSKPRDIERLKELGVGKPASEKIIALYRQAFDEFGPKFLWNRRASKRPTIAQALVIAETLRREGSMAVRPLVAEIEEVCRAALSPSDRDFTDHSGTPQP